MNRARRKELRDIIKNIEEQIQNLRQVASDEEDYRDNMPESLEGSEKYDRAGDVVDLLNEAADSIEDALTEASEQLDDAMA